MNFMTFNYLVGVGVSGLGRINVFRIGSISGFSG